ncbi:hypothetical protein AAFC00_002146 [Neodothiora populina]|uniref:Spc7 kinetochore protein domain-containing protein n=1 Tax=Neodothiora populina TaxID=2781224 RepID=A0ABR3PGI2_9PEZI
MEDKENMSPVRSTFDLSPLKMPAANKSTSPPKASKKSKARSRSIGPEELEATRRTSPVKGRRRSAVTQVIQLPPKGILPSRDEELKRKEARRKSLANRRVSFAPEATLHTWDVIEYMRDATTSSLASSEHSRRASSASNASAFSAMTPDGHSWEQASDPPSTPPEQADDDEDLPASPEHQRDAHQKKHRRSSVIPPMNFNNPEDEFSSSPVSGSSIIDGSSEVEGDDAEDGEEDEDDGEYDSDLDGESTGMSLDDDDDDDDNTNHDNNNTVQSLQSADTDSTDSSLTQRLRQASEMAGTRGIDYDERAGEYYDDEEDVDENGDMSMEMVTQEVDHQFKPWAQQNYGPPPMAKNIIAVQDQENINPFSPAFRNAYSHRKPQGVPSTVGQDTEPDTNDMSMDFTRSLGRILSTNNTDYQDSPRPTELGDNDMTMDMDMTCAVGGILPNPQQQPGRLQQIDADASDDDVSMDMTRAVGGILSPPKAHEPTQSFDDQTMEFTQAIGKIIQNTTDKSPETQKILKRRLSTIEDETSSASATAHPQRRTVAQVSAKRRRSSAQRLSLGDATMDFTVAIGGIQAKASPAKRRTSLRSRRSSAMSSTHDDQTMEFTTAIGGIHRSDAASTTEQETPGKGNENMSMDFTAVVGGINVQNLATEVSRPTTPKDGLSPAKTEVPTTPNRDGHFREAEDQSAKKLLTPIFENQLHGSAVKDSAGSRTSSARKSAASPRKSPAKGRQSPASHRKNNQSPRKSLRLASKTPDREDSFAASISEATSRSPASALRSSDAGKAEHSRKSPLATYTAASDVASLTPEAPPTTLPAEELTQSFSPPSEQKTLVAHAEEIVYPTLPNAGQAVSTVSHHSHTVSEAGSPLRAALGSPAEVDMDVLRSASPVVQQQLERSPIETPATPSEPAPQVTQQAAVAQQSSPDTNSMTPQQSRNSPAQQLASPQAMQSIPRIPAANLDVAPASPATAMMTPQQAPEPDSIVLTPQGVSADRSRTFTNSMRLLSTPRKDTGTTPLRRLRGMTPMKSPVKRAVSPRKGLTPKSKTPQLMPQAAVADLGQQVARELFAVSSTNKEAPKVKLNEFLDMAGIKFMDLALPTKRRFTIAPTPSREASGNEDEGKHGDDIELESAAVAGACTMPMLDLFQHSCRELKRYISEGKSFVKTLEKDVYAESPPLISAYVNGDAQRKAELDVHMRSIKTNARFGSKEIWYDWRGKLLDGLEEGLKGIKTGLTNDERVLSERNELLDSLLPNLLAQHEKLSTEAGELEDAAAATSREDKVELGASRERLVSLKDDIEERKRMLATLQEQLREQDDLIEGYTDGQTECLAAIREAERVKESCRGWTIDEVADLKASVAKLEAASGWFITSASSSTLTMTYRSTIALYFDSGAFLIPGSNKQPYKLENQPISLTYVGGSDTAALPTETRFFLQLMRAQLQCLEQRSTSIKALLHFVSTGWDVTNKITDAIRRLRVEHPVSVAILSDERLGVQVDVLLPKVQTKVRLSFEVSAAIVTFDDGGFEVGTHIGVQGKVVYGEQYNEHNMQGFLARRCGERGDGWEGAVRELRVRLIATGRKS